MVEPIRIASLKPGEERQVLDFLKPHYEKEYRTSPDKLLDKCFIAWRESSILGVIGLEFSKAGNPFEVEEFFEFNFEQAIGSRSLGVNFGRWSSIEAVSGRALAYTAVDYACEQGRTVALASSKPRVVNYIRKQYGLRFTIFRVPMKHSNAKFFREGPKPIIYTWLLEEWRAALGKDIPPFVIFDL